MHTLPLVSETNWTGIGHSALLFVSGHNLRHEQIKLSGCDNPLSFDKTVAESVKSIGFKHNECPFPYNSWPMQCSKRIAGPFKKENKEKNKIKNANNFTIYLLMTNVGRSQRSGRS